MFKREINNGNIIHISKMNPVIKWAIRVPRKYQIEIIKEMVDCGLLKKLSRDNYELITTRTKTLYDSLGEPLWSD
jgi:hypothetical protein